MEFGSGRSSDFRTVRPRHRSAKTHTCFEARDCGTQVPTFRRKSAASSPVNTPRDPELGERSMIAVPLSCEDFDEDDWNMFITILPSAQPLLRGPLLARRTGSGARSSRRQRYWQKSATRPNASLNRKAREWSRSHRR